jgi:hypothetical protein
VNHIRADVARLEGGEFVRVTAGSKCDTGWDTYVTCRGCTDATLLLMRIVVGYV